MPADENDTLREVVGTAQARLCPPYETVNLFMAVGPVAMILCHDSLQ